MDWTLIVHVFSPQSFEKADRSPDSVALVLGPDLEDLTSVEM